MRKLFLSLIHVSSVILTIVTLWLGNGSSALAQPASTVWLGDNSSALAQSASIPKTCRLGVYVVGLRDFDLAKKSFNSDFWLWSVCPSKELKPLESIDFIDTKRLSTAYDSVLERKDKFGGFQAQNSVYWSQKKVSGEFYHPWDTQNFPFDRHTLEISMEEAVYDTATFVYTPDLKNSSYKQGLQLDGWTITDFKVREAHIPYNTTYGDPELANGQSQYSRVTVAIDIQRNTLISFFKLHAVVYIGFLLSLAAYFLNPVETSLMGAKISAPVGALFAVVVNQRAAESILGRSDVLTLVDQIHITSMAYILLSIIIAIYSRMVGERGNKQQALRINQLSALIAGISFTVVNLILIIHAARIG